MRQMVFLMLYSNIDKSISGCKMKLIIGSILIIISIIITVIVAFLTMTSVDDMGEENEL